MQVLSSDQARAWCNERGVQADAMGSRVSLGYIAGAQHCLQATVGTQSPPVIAMALLLQDLAEPDPQDFAGGLIWMREWDIWDEASERAGRRMLEILRREFAHTDAPTLRDGPAHLFGPREFVDAQLFVMTPLMFQWDVYIVPASARCLTLISHDDYVQIDACTSTVLSRINERFKLLEWNPRECSP